MSQEKQTCRSHLPDAPTAGRPSPNLIPRHPAVSAQVLAPQVANRIGSTRLLVPIATNKYLHLPRDFSKKMPDLFLGSLAMPPSLAPRRQEWPGKVRT